MFDPCRMDKYRPKRDPKINDFTFEAHIYFDDAFRDVEGSRHLNEYAENLVTAIKEAYMYVYLLPALGASKALFTPVCSQWKCYHFEFVMRNAFCFWKAVSSHGNISETIFVYVQTQNADNAAVPTARSQVGGVDTGAATIVHTCKCPYSLKAAFSSVYIETGTIVFQFHSVGACFHYGLV